MGTGAVNIMKAKDTSETAPIYVKVLLLHLKICANIRKFTEIGADFKVET